MKLLSQFDIANHPVALTFDDINIVPGYSCIESRSSIDISTRLVGDVYLTNPIIPANMDTICELEMMQACAKHGSIGFLHRFMPLEDTALCIREFIDSIPQEKAILLGVSIGVNAVSASRVNLALEIFRAKSRGPDDRLVFLIDVAHGDHYQVLKEIEHVKKQLHTFNETRAFVIAGNIATGVAAKRLIAAGADGLKVGIGNGSLCETRIRTGAGVPQVSALAEVCAEIRAYTRSPYISMVADGGVKYPGDVVKALWLGAGSVMSGYMFAGTDETPGMVMKKGLFPNEREVKIYRGSASHASKIARGESKNIEGNIREIPTKGPVSYVFDQIKDGVQSGFSYVGARNHNEFFELASAIQITQSGVIEARPNLLDQ